MPSVTYVDREKLDLERDLRSELNEGHKVVCLTGPTKSGKTVLCRHVLGESPAVWANGGQVETSSDLWAQILGKCDLPEEETLSDGGGATVGLRTLVSVQRSMNEGQQQKFNNKNKSILLEYMRINDTVLVIDDFHYLPVEVQKEVVRSIKSEIFDGLSVILIAVPHRAFDAINVEREMEGRFAHITIPSWEPEDLVLIANRGFPALNMKVTKQCREEFAQEAFGSPLLMQRFCNRLCSHFDVSETLPREKHFNPSDDARRKIYEAVARQFGFPTFEKLSKGPQSRSKRIPRNLKGADAPLDIYQCVLRAVARTGPKEKISYNEIRDQLREFMAEESVPQKNEVSSALGHMSSIAKDDLEGEPVLEWSDDFLYLTDPFLMFYMRWSNRVGAQQH